MGAHYAKGRYVCEVVNQALGKSSNKGTPQFVLRFKVLGTPDPADSTAYIPDANQYERSMYRYFTDASAKYTIDDLRSLGFQGNSFKLLDPSTQNFHNFAGLTIDMICDHEKNDKGEQQEKWGLVRGMSEFKVEPLEPAKMRELDSLFGKQLKETARPATQAKPQPAAAMATAGDDPGITDEDIPF